MPQYDDNTKSWRADIKLGGKRYRKRGFVTRQSALLWEAQRRVSFEKQELGIPQKNDNIEINEILDSYLQHSEKYKKYKAYRRDKSAIGIWKEFFEKKSFSFLDQINENTWRDFVSWRENQYTSRGSLPSRRTINIDLVTMRRAFDLAIERKVIAKNPFASIQTYKEEKPGIPRYLTAEEITGIEKIIREVAEMPQGSKAFLPAFQVLVRTGMRSGELCDLTIDNLDWERKQIILRPDQTKAGSMRLIPMTPVVAEILKEREQEAEKVGRTWLFATRTGGRQDTKNLGTRFRFVIKLAEERGIVKNGREINIHTLRKTYISHAIMSGTDPIRVMAIVGHRDWSTMKRYLALSPKYIGSEVELPY